MGLLYVSKLLSIVIATIDSGWRTIFSSFKIRIASIEYLYDDTNTLSHPLLNYLDVKKNKGVYVNTLPFIAFTGHLNPVDNL